MKAFLIVISLLSIFSCTTSKPEPPPVIKIQGNPAAVSAPVIENDGANFDPKSVSEAEFKTAMSEIRLLIEEINRVIQAKNYAAWVSHLSDDFVSAINSPEYLAQVSEFSVQLKSRNIVLKTPLDYFTEVVVPSRENISANAHLDDIEFLSHTRVKAFTIVLSRRLRLFEFVKDKGVWKIALSG
jgi:hypothetical protein